MKKTISLLICVTLITAFSCISAVPAFALNDFVVNNGENVTIDGTEGYVNAVVQQGGILNIKPGANVKLENLISNGTFNIGENATCNVQTCMINSTANFEKCSILKVNKTSMIGGVDPVTINGRVEGFSDNLSINAITMGANGCIDMIVTRPENLEIYKILCDSKNYYCKAENYKVLIKSKNHQHVFDTKTQKCIACKEQCTHSSYDKTTHKCLGCGIACPHKTWKNGVCTACSYACPHQKAVCNTCGYDLTANMKTGSVFSGGNWTVICSVLSAVIGFIVAMLIFKKKKTNKKEEM